MASRGDLTCLPTSLINQTTSKHKKPSNTYIYVMRTHTERFLKNWQYFIPNPISVHCLGAAHQHGPDRAPPGGVHPAPGGQHRGGPVTGSRGDRPAVRRHDSGKEPRRGRESSYSFYNYRIYLFKEISNTLLVQSFMGFLIPI